jgi:hypothetical protein
MEATSSKRPVYLYEVPPQLAQESGVAQVGLVTLSADEELTCFKRARNDSAKMATELSMAALVEADGKKLSGTDGSVDSFWKNLDPRVRQLVMTAYGELHAAKEEDQQSFLKSRTVRVA